MMYPWQVEQWQQLSRAKQTKRLPHALLLSGSAGMGKLHFAECFIRAFFCTASRDVAALPEQGVNLACECHPCRLISGRAHPNLLWIEPEKPGSAIKIDQVREISEFIQQTSLQGDARFVLINTAHAMNASSANALLKTLEEPASGSMLLLISDQFGQLPATILSRCQRLAFPRPTKEVALAWLAPQLKSSAVDPEKSWRLANGAPLAALHWAQGDTLATRERLFQAVLALIAKKTTPLQVAAEFQAFEPMLLLDFLLSWVMDLLRLQLACAENTLLNQDFHAELTALLPQISHDHGHRYLTFLQQCRAELSLGLNLNKPLLVENMFIRWAECA